MKTITFKDLGINKHLLKNDAPKTHIPKKTENKDNDGRQVLRGKSVKRNTKNIYRRAFSESSLLDILEHDLEEGYSYHCLTGGDIDALSFLKVIVRQQSLKYCLLSTWCMAMEDVGQIKEWIDSGVIERMDCYCGEIFPGSYPLEYKELSAIANKSGGRVCIFRNHSKVFAGTGKKFAFGIASSANINTNPRTENTVVTIDRELFKFYKSYFDGIVSFTKDSNKWTPWEAKHARKTK